MNYNNCTKCGSDNIGHAGKILVMMIFCKNCYFKVKAISLKIAKLVWNNEDLSDVDKNNYIIEGDK